MLRGEYLLDERKYGKQTIHTNLVSFLNEIIE